MSMWRDLWKKIVPAEAERAPAPAPARRRSVLDVQNEETCQMAFSPNQSPIYGGGSIVVAFGASTRIPPDADLYLVFDGQKQRHIVQAQLVNGQTLQAYIPEHDRAESVRLSVCLYHDPDVRTLASTQFQYVLTSAHYLAEYLFNSVDEGLPLDPDSVRSDEFDLKNECLETLDGRLCKAVGHIGVDKDWNVLGTNTEPPQDTLLHFCARLGLHQFASLLLTRPGGREACSLVNGDGERACDLARDSDLRQLALLLDPEYSPESGTEPEESDVTETLVYTNQLATLTLCDKQLAIEDLVLCMRQRLLESGCIHPPSPAPAPSSSSASLSQNNERTSDTSRVAHGSGLTDSTVILDNPIPETCCVTSENSELDLRTQHHVDLLDTTPTDTLNLSADSLESTGLISLDSLEHSPEKLSQIEERNSDSDFVEIDDILVGSIIEDHSSSCVLDRTSNEGPSITTTTDDAVAPLDSYQIAACPSSKRVSIVTETAGLLGAVIGVDISGNLSVSETMDNVVVVKGSDVTMDDNVTVNNSVKKADNVTLDNTVKNDNVTMDDTVTKDDVTNEDGVTETARARNKYSSSDHSIPEEVESDSAGELDDDAFRQQTSPPVRPTKLQDGGGGGGGQSRADIRGRQCSSVSSIPSIHVTSPHSTTTVIDNFPSRIHSDGDAGQLHDGLGERKEQLCRFSSSCPSLHEDPVQEAGNALSDSLVEQGCHSSMVDIAVQSEPPSSRPVRSYNAVTPSAADHVHKQQETRVKICVNDVTVDTSVTDNMAAASVNEEEGEGKVARTRSSLGVETEKTKKNKRRRSWCNTVPGKEQGQRRQHKLAVMGRSMSLSSLDSNDESSSSSDDEDDEDDDEDEEDTSYSAAPAGSSTPSPEYRHPATTTTAHSLTDVRLSSEEHVLLRSSPGQRAQSPDVGLSNCSAILDLSSLTKSVSSPSIPCEDANQKVFTFDTSTEDGSHRTSSISASSGSQTFSPDRSRDEHITPERFFRPTQKFATMRADINGRASDGDEEVKEKPKKQRRHSVFSKLGSYRNKKIKERELKRGSGTHQYVGVSFSNSTACDVCGKSMANKPAMQCQNCMANVHENTCKDQIAPCNKLKQFRSLQKQGASFNQGSNRGASLPGSALRLSHSIKETRTVPVIKQALQPNNTMVSQRNPSPPGYGHFQWRRVASKLGIDKMITEETDEHQAKDTTDGVTTNMVGAMSASMESLEDACLDLEDLVDAGDIWLLSQDSEPEAWSITVDKRTLKKMTAKDIKRQDHIWELIMTEKHHCRTLKIMQKIFSRGMSVELGMNQELIDRIFPELDELIDIHLGFLQQLLERQGVRSDKMFEYLGDLLVNQFGYHSGERMKSSYGEFCRKHKEAVACYKDLLKNNRNFQNFIKKCSTNSVCRKLGIPECILLVTHRMTKYPIMIEYIINTTKDREDKELLEDSLRFSKEILSDVDKQVGMYEREQRLLDIYHKVDARSTAVFKGKKFKKSDLLSSNRKLIYEGTVGWKPARGKPIEVIAVVLNDLILFLQENNQKYNFFTQDNKSAVVSLHKLIVREKGDTRDSRGIYLISQNKIQPEMYELVCRSNDVFKNWVSHLRDAIAKCANEVEEEEPAHEADQSLEEINRDAREEESIQHVLKLLDDLDKKDQTIYRACDEKLTLVAEMMQVNSGKRPAGIKIQDGVIDIDVEEVKKSALGEVSRLETWLASGVPVHLGRSISSVTPGSPALPAVPIPKRAETFTAFDTSKAAMAAKRRGVYAVRDSQGRSTSLQNLNINKQELETEFTLTVDMAKTWSMRRGSAGQNGENAEKKAQKEEARLRRMSTSILSFLAKQSSPQPDDKSPSPSPAPSPAVSPSAHSPQPASPGTGMGEEEVRCKPIMTQKEANVSLTLVSHCLTCLSTLATRQHTELESKIIQLEQATKQANKLAETVRSLQEKRSNFRHDQQLEELRNLQETIRKEKEEWERSKEKDRIDLDSEREDLGQQQADLDKKKAEFKKEQDELKRQKEALQRQMDLHRLQVAQVQQQQQHLNQQKQEIQLQLQHRHDNDSAVLQELDISHKRSNSADGKDQSFEPMKAEYSASLKEPLNRRQGSTSEPRARPVSEFAQPVRNKDLPIHLYSATNEQKVGSVKQQLPMKLSQRMSSSGNLGNLVSMGSMKHSNSSPGNVTTHPTLARLASASSLNNSQRHITTSAGMLPMKLAENSKRMSSPTGETKGKKEKHKEESVIYF